MPDRPHPTPRPRPARPALLVVGLAVVALVAASCGGGGSDGGSGTAADDGTPVSGGEVVYGLEAETLGGWCLPESTLAISGIMVTRAIYDTLTTPNADGEFVPYLAESLEHNDDFTQWTITVRDGVTFHDGTPLTAQVVKNNLDAFLGRYPARTPLLFPFVLKPIQSVEVVDDRTVSITTAQPWPALPAYLYGGGRLGIMAQAQLDDPDTCDTALIGTGPFELEEWAVNDHLSATRNPDYWATDGDGRQLPYLDRIEFRPIPDSDARLNAFLAGELDMLHTSSAPAVETLEAEAEDGTIGLVQTLANTEVGFLMLNASRPPFDSPVARRAVAHALDRDLYQRVRTLGLFPMASGPFPPGSKGYLEDAGFPEYDLAEAKDLVAQYEAESGRPFEFSYVHSADSESSPRRAVPPGAVRQGRHHREPVPGGTGHPDQHRPRQRLGHDPLPELPGRRAGRELRVVVRRVAGELRQVQRPRDQRRAGRRPGGDGSRRGHGHLRGHQPRVRHGGLQPLAGLDGVEHRQRRGHRRRHGTGPARREPSHRRRRHRALRGRDLGRLGVLTPLRPGSVVADVEVAVDGRGQAAQHHGRLPPTGDGGPLGPDR